MTRISIIAYIICCCSILYFGIFFYPKWNKPATEATIGWDVSGYYSYLPSAIIYHDLKECKFLDTIINIYHPTPNKMQGFKHSSGNFVLKYPMGQALQFLPWFTIGHFATYFTSYPSDGFSIPYQAAISWGSLIIALIGLWFSRVVLLEFYSEKVTAVSLFLLTLGSNYLNYASIDNAMTHNWLFTCYTLVIYSTIKFYKKPSLFWATIIGIFCGWAALTRPSEIIIVLIPLLWGINSKNSLIDRIKLIKMHWVKYLISCLVLISIGFLQALYWKFVSGEWLVYTYEDQGFSWLRPHILDVVFSYRSGWLIYSPLMVIPILGMYSLKTKHSVIFPTILIYFLLNLYIVSAWDIWWYGGSLGMRALVQSYAVLLIPFGAFIEMCLKANWRTVLLIIFSSICIYLNIWWTVQAHRGSGAFVSEQMTRAYFWQVIGKNYFNKEWLKLLDTDEIYLERKRNDIDTLYFSGFEMDKSRITEMYPISGTKSLLLSNENQFSDEISLDLKNLDKYWIRVSCKIRCEEKEWDQWKMTQLIVRFKSGNDLVKESMIRLQRYIDGNELKSIYIDTAVPQDKNFDKITVLFWSGNGDKKIRIDDLTIESFNYNK